jgi:hypothetical protein
MPFKMVGFFLRSKAGFPPDLESTRMWEEPGKRKTALLRHLQHSKHLVAGAQFSPVLAPHMCRREVWVAALNLIEAHSHTLSRFLDGSNFRAPLSPRCTALSVASCGNRGAAPNFGTRVPGNLGGEGTKKKVLSFVHEFSVELVEKLQCRKVFPVQSLISSYKSQINQERAKEEPKLEAGKEVGGPTGPGCAPHCELLVKTLAARAI